MGNLQAAEMASATNAGLVPLQQAVSWHLTSNHFPPIGEFTDLLVEVIQKIQSGDLDEDSEISLGFDTYRILPSRAHQDDDGEWFVNVYDFIEATHAWFFIEQED